MTPRCCVLALLLLSADALGARASAEDAYQQARRSYYALKADKNRRAFRHQWLRVVARFEAVANHFPKSERAPDALFTAGQLLDELSRISQQDEDLESARADYEKLCTLHPKHRLADDAALALAKIEAEREGDPDSARKLLERGLAENPHADRAPKMRALLASLGPELPRKEKPKKPEFPAQPSTKISRARADSSEEPGGGTASRAAPHAPVTVAHVDPGEGRDAAPDSHRKLVGPGSSPERPQSARTPLLAVSTNPGSAAADASPDHAGPPEASSVDDDDDSDDRELATDPAPPAAVARERLRSARPRQGDITLAEQLGLKVRRVVIDAGHGGHDSGAVGPHGTREKDVSLAIARKLARILGEAGLEVLLTRDDDRFVRLEDRARIANDARGDLFISIHCNSSPGHSLRGIETYTLNTSSDRYSIRLAARENSSSEKGISDLQFILADLATKANTEESSRLASRVQHSLAGHLAGKYGDIKSLGTKQALFYVLLGAKMPAILVETSFLSNPVEEKRLGSPGYQDDVASAIAAGVQDFLGNRQRLAKVD